MFHQAGTTLQDLEAEVSKRRWWANTEKWTLLESLVGEAMGSVE